MNNISSECKSVLKSKYGRLVAFGKLKKKEKAVKKENKKKRARTRIISNGKKSVKVLAVFFGVFACLIIII